MSRQSQIVLGERDTNMAVGRKFMWISRANALLKYALSSTMLPQGLGLIHHSHVLLRPAVNAHKEACCHCCFFELSLLSEHPNTSRML